MKNILFIFTFSLFLSSYPCWADVNFQWSNQSDSDLRTVTIFNNHHTQQGILSAHRRTEFGPVDFSPTFYVQPTFSGDRVMRLQAIHVPDGSTYTPLITAHTDGNGNITGYSVSNGS